MSNPLFKLYDIVEISPEKALTDLSKSDKHRFMDRILDAKREEKRGLLVDFNLSSAGRRINNRIYTPAGQRKGVDSWTQPFPRPIIRNHNKQEDPIGRFKSVTYHDLDDKALGFFKNARDYMAVKDAMESDDPRKIARALSQYKLLLSKKWTGIGELAATARISDEAAIEKFLDGRYMTFSAGSHTDRYTCSRCFTDWADGEQCNHRPGEIVDGEVAVFICGGLYGEEGSVLTNPANDFSTVRSLVFSDSLNYSIDQSDCLTDVSTIYITDGVVDFSTEDSTDTHQEKTMDAEQIAVLLDALMPKLLERLKEVKDAQEVTTEDTSENTTQNDSENTTQEEAGKPLSVDWSAFDAACAALKESLTDSKVEVEKQVTVKDPEDCQKISDLETQIAELIAAKDAAEAKVLELEDSQKDHTSALTLVDELRAEVTALTEKLDIAKSSVQNQDGANQQLLDKKPGTVENPSESGSPSLRDANLGETSLDGYEKSVVEKFKKIKDSNGAASAYAYISGLKGRGQLSRKFNVDLHLSKETN